MRLAIDTHAITCHLALRLLIRQPGGLVVGLRSEAMLEGFGVTEANWRAATERIPHFAISESPFFVGRAVAALAADPDAGCWRLLSAAAAGEAPRRGVCAGA